MEITPEPTTPRRGRNRKAQIAAVLALLALASAAGFWYRHATTKIARLRLVVDWESQDKVLCSEAAARDLAISICRNDLLIDAIHSVDRHEVDTAVIPAGRGIEGENLRHVTFLDRELLHLFVRPDLLAQGFGGLRGRRIWLGTADSDVRKVAGEVLEYLGLRPGDYLDDARPFQEMIQEPSYMPDAVFTLASLPSSRGEKLARMYGYQLLEMPFGEALTITKPYLEDATIPLGLYSAAPAIPYAKLHTIGVRATVIAHKDVPEIVITRLLGVLYESDFSANAGIETLNEHLLLRPGEYPFHDGTRAYIHRNDPWLGTWLSGVVHWITGTMLSAFSATLLVWQWIQRRQGKVGELLRRCNDLDLNAQSAASRGEFDERSLAFTLGQLSRVKAEVLALQHESFSGGDRHLGDLVSRIEVLQQTLPALVRTSASEASPSGLPGRKVA